MIDVRKHVCIMLTITCVFLMMHYAQCQDATFPDVRDFVQIIPIDDGNGDTDLDSRANTHINTVAYKTQGITTANGFQFLTYYHHEGNLIVARRKIEDNSWTVRATEFTSYNVNDPHCTSSIAVDGSGYLHIAWGMHGGGPLLYTRSTTPVTDDNPMQLHGDQEGNAGRLANEIPLQERIDITYPEFYNIPGSGDLLLAFRTGGSGNGDWNLMRWQNDTQKWEAIHAPWIGAQDPASDFLTVCAYPNTLVYDSKGRLHATWNWRTGSNPATGQRGYQTNHDLLYAWSPDNGRTWKRSTGDQYTIPIYESTAEVVVEITEGSSYINAADMAVDLNDRPMTAIWWAPGAQSGNHTRQQMLAWDDGTGTPWNTVSITSRQAENTNDAEVSQPIQEPELRQYRLARPIVQVDDKGRIIVVYCDHQRDYTITAAYTTTSKRDEWHFIDIDSGPMGRWEPVPDRARWDTDGILSMIYLQSGMEHMASPIAVIEWDARSYFEAME